MDVVKHAKIAETLKKTAPKDPNTSFVIYITNCVREKLRLSSDEVCAPKYIKPP